MVNIKQGDSVQTKYGVGEVERVLFSKESCKPYAADLKLSSGQHITVYLCDLSKMREMSH